MARSGHGKTSFSITPENAIKKSRIGSIRPGEIHSGRFLRPLTPWGIHLVDETVVAIAPISGERRPGAACPERCRGCDRQADRAVRTAAVRFPSLLSWRE